MARECGVSQEKRCSGRERSVWDHRFRPAPRDLLCPEEQGNSWKLLKPWGQLEHSQGEGSRAVRCSRSAGLQEQWERVLCVRVYVFVLGGLGVRMGPGAFPAPLRPLLHRLCADLPAGTPGEVGEGEPIPVCGIWVPRAQPQLLLTPGRGRAGARH